MNATELLFSYGTLQNTSVQIQTFGRELKGEKDQLLGYKLEMVEIKSCEVVDLSGEAHHPIAIATGDVNDAISGVVFEITPEELLQSDEYEVDEYQRVMGKTRSGKQTWVYVSANNELDA